MQAKDLDADLVVNALSLLQGFDGRPVSLWDLTGALDVPEKVLRAKLRRLIKAGRVTGCVCGCRGDFEIAEPPAPPETRLVPGGFEPL